MIRTKDKMFMEKLLDKDEAKTFIIFLRGERERHVDDIIKINRTIGYLKKKFRLK